MNLNRQKALAAIALLSLAATAPLRADDAAIPITPSGHIELFNGRDFTGWTFCMTGGADPMKTWSVTNGVIHCTGTPTGYIRTLQSYRDYALTVEWRFLKVTPTANNTGVLVHIQSPDKVWPMCIQTQGKHLNQGDLFLMMGAESKEHRGKNANTPVVKNGPSNEHPVGEWDTVLTVCSNDTVKAYVNGKFMNQTTECTITNGTIGIQSEGGDIEIRKMYLDPLPK